MGSINYYAFNALSTHTLSSALLSTNLYDIKKLETRNCENTSEELSETNKTRNERHLKKGYYKIDELKLDPSLFVPF